MSKKLVAFFSASGIKKVAGMIAEEAKANLFRLSRKFRIQRLILTGWIKNPEAVWK